MKNQLHVLIKSDASIEGTGIINKLILWPITKIKKGEKYYHQSSSVLLR